MRCCFFGKKKKKTSESELEPRINQNTTNDLSSQIMRGSYQPEILKYILSFVGWELYLCSRVNKKWHQILKETYQEINYYEVKCWEYFVIKLKLEFFEFIDKNRNHKDFHTIYPKECQRIANQFKSEAILTLADVETILNTLVRDLKLDRIKYFACIKNGFFTPHIQLDNMITPNELNITKSQYYLNRGTEKYQCAYTEWHQQYQKTLNQTTMVSR